MRISRLSVVPNDFKVFLRSHPLVTLICFNGKEAARLYRRTVLACLDSPMNQIRSEVLPSTSQAHATMPFDEKLLRWSIIQRECET